MEGSRFSEKFDVMYRKQHKNSRILKNFYMKSDKKLTFAVQLPLSKKNCNAYLPRSSQHYNNLYTSFPQVFPQSLDMGLPWLRFTQTS